MFMNFTKKIIKFMNFDFVKEKFLKSKKFMNFYSCFPLQIKIKCFFKKRIELK